MKKKRKNYFIDKGFQMEFILKFCGLVAIGCIVFGAAVYIFSSRTLTTSFENSRLVVKSTADYLVPFLLSGGIIVGLLTAVITSITVLIMTHRIAGPIYRFERYAQKIGSGELGSNLQIRKKDQFQNLIGTFNKMREDIKKGIVKVIELSEKLDNEIEQLSDSSNIVPELKKDSRALKKTLAYFKI